MSKHKNAPKFRDVARKRIRLKKADKVMLFAPHTTERLAVSPLMRRLSEKLKVEKKEVFREIIDDIDVRIVVTAEKLKDKKVSYDEKELLERLFRLEDAWIRLQTLTEILERHPGATVLEVHALDKDYREGSRFDIAPYFYRLPDTRVLILRNLVEEYGIPIRKGLKMIDKTNDRHKAIVRCFAELNLRKITEEYQRLLDILSKNIGSIAMVEIPAYRYSQIRKTGIELIDRLIFKLQKLPKPMTEFEERYMIYRSEPAALSDRDIDGIMKMISG